jgi:hypothetical protein
MRSGYESRVGLGKGASRGLTAEQMMAFYVQNDAMDRHKPAGRPVLMDLRATGWLRMGILAVFLVAVGLRQQWTRLHCGYPPSGKELEALSTARSYLRCHAGEQFQRYASIVDRTTYRIVPNPGQYVAKTTQPKLFKPVVFLAEEVLNVRESFLAAVLLHESVMKACQPRSSRIFCVQWECMPVSRRSRKRTPAFGTNTTWIPQKRASGSSECGGLRSSPARCNRRPQSPRVKIVLLKTLELLP